MKSEPENIHIQKSSESGMERGASSTLNNIFSPPLEGKASLHKWFLGESNVLDILPDKFESYYYIYVISGRLELLNNGSVLSADDGLVINNSSDYCIIQALEDSVLLFYSLGDYDLIKSYRTNSNLLEEFVFQINLVDKHTYGHSLRVKYLCLDLAIHMNRDDIDLEALYYAALYHDVGKINIPAEILTKPHTLSNEERQYIYRHPLDSYLLVKEKMSDLTSQIVYQHHERLDGSGYPQGLRGNEILLEAQILAVCDSFDAALSSRCYSPGSTREEALEILTANRTKNNPDIIDELVSLVSDEHYRSRYIPNDYDEKFSAPVIRVVKGHKRERRKSLRY